jgi:hypothetical protein
MYLQLQQPGWAVHDPMVSRTKNLPEMQLKFLLTFSFQRILLKVAAHILRGNRQPRYPSRVYLRLLCADARAWGKSP